MDEKRDISFLIKKFVRAKIDGLLENSSWSRAALARLRRGIGKEPGELPELFEYFLEGMTEELYGRGDEASYPERAIYTALTLFALHQQGKEQPMNMGWNVGSKDKGNSLGAAVGLLVNRDKDREPAFKRRFDAVITADVFTELAHHARGMIQLLKAEDITLDYPCLADDLFWYQFDELRNRVRLRWGEDYYRFVWRSAAIENKEEQDEES